MHMIVPRYGSSDDVIGLPARAMVMSNSERSTAACPLKWLFAYGDGLEPTARSGPMEFGSALHACTEDVNLWFMKHDTPYPADGATVCVWCRASGHCPKCNTTSRGPAARAGDAWHNHAVYETNGDIYTSDDASNDYKRLLSVFEGWVHTYGLNPSPRYRVVAPELRMALPVLTPKGRPYAPRTWLVPDTRGGWRIARTGESSLPGAKAVRWPWYQVVTVDALVQDRRTGDLMVYETKTSASPAQRLQSVSIDPQMAGYCHAVQSVVRKGLIEGVDKKSAVRGYIYDVMSSARQNDPKVLKPVKVKTVDPTTGLPVMMKSRYVYELDADGNAIVRSPGLSRNVNAGVPSWRYRAAIKANGFKEDDYFDHMLNLMAGIDKRLYVRDEVTSGREVSERYARELYAVVQRLSTFRRRSAEMKHPDERELHFPRQPVCIAGYGCAFRGPCLQDGELVRADYGIAETVRWEDNTEAAEKPQEDIGW